MREPDRLRPDPRLHGPARPPRAADTPPLVLAFADRPDGRALPVQEQFPPPCPAPGPTCPTEGRRGWRTLAMACGALAIVWGGLTGWDAASWVFGIPVIAMATALVLAFPAAPAWQLSFTGALRFAVWFAAASARGSLDVAGRAIAWRMPLSPGFRSYRTSLPPGPARIVFANAITLLPGTLSADLEGDRIDVHMLDMRSDLDAELGPLEARVRALFALPDTPADSAPILHADPETGP